jgi:hypothetical protein
VTQRVSADDELTIAAVSFSFIASKSDEVGLARLVAGRLSLSARG